MSIFARVLTALLMALALLPERTPAAEAKVSPNYFISIDGLQPALLQALHAKHKLSATRGFSWLLDTGLVFDRAWPVITTLTAPSHISTITCSPPSRHGIIANNFLAGGRKVSGFDTPFASEPLWSAARRQGKKVLALAYVGADGKTPERRADWGLAYPDDAHLGPATSAAWNLLELPAATGWTLPTALTAAPKADWRATTLTVTLDPKTHETRLVHVLIDAARPAALRLWVATTPDFAEAQPVSPETHLFFTEKSRGIKRRITFRARPAHPGTVVLATSRVSYNNAYPEAFRQRLDDLNLVWPDPSISRQDLSLAELIEEQAELDRFLAEVGARLVPELQPDLVLFYQPLIDTVGHRLQAKLPQPFDPDAKDLVTHAFVRAFHIVDEDLSTLLAGADDRSVVELMGDHGMDPVRQVVNVAQLLPRDHVGKVEMLASGSLLLLYPPAGGGAAAASVADAMGDALRAKLANLRDGGKPVLAAARRQHDFATRRVADYTQEWQHGEALWAFLSESGYWFQYEPFNRDLFHPSSAGGMHGTALSVPTMATTLLVHGPTINPAHHDETSLINAVPTFTNLLGIQPPKDCLGKALK